MIKSAILTFTLFSVAAATAASDSLSSNTFVEFTQDERGTPMAHVSITASDLFSNVPHPLSGFDINVGYTNYNKTLFQKVADDLAAHEKSSLLDKVATVLSVLYNKEYRHGIDPHMDEDYDRLSSTVRPENYSIGMRANPYITWATNHVIKLTTCAAFLSCISGTNCSFFVTINQAPRSRCESQGGQNCCMSWANYDVKAGFFKATWTTCYNSRPNDTESCEGYDNGSGNGGDVCFSDRASGCT
jgi:hypothetical protein